ncbi:MAG: DUF2306 domain-containing protein [Gammaproteobacteria bacterium]
MNDSVMRNMATETWLPQKLFRSSVKMWFSVAAAGHWIFLAYILAVFYPPVIEHGLEGLKGSHLPSGFVKGDTLGNLASVGHVLLAAIIIGGGPLQLIPGVRNRFPTFHRWLGRSYLVAAVSSAIAGLYMTWTRSPLGDVITQIGISGDGVLIIVFAAFAVHHAMGRRFKAHRQWALRLFLVASAVWFYRVGLMGWAMLTGGIGVEWETLTGPYIYFLTFAQYLLPLAMLEWYFYCERQSTPSMLIAFSTTLFTLTALMAFGIFAATMGLWLPGM